MRIGVDWGGTKLEVALLDGSGEIAFRKRVSTPASYEASLAAVCALVSEAEKCAGTSCTVGVGIPGTVSARTGLVKNANSTWLNGMPLKVDLETRLDRETRIQNDANCFAVSEAVDGAGRGYRTVAGLILGTGCGCGVVIDAKPLVGRNAIAGEFGHTPLPWMNEDEFPGEACWCGQSGCLETFISGTGFERDFQRRSGEDFKRSAEDISSLEDNPWALEALHAYQDRLARALALLANILDPDVFVLGGGMSNVTEIYEPAFQRMKQYVFSDVCDTPVVRAMHGDSSGVRGAAWLW